ncbi:MAG: cobaltochelatase subunit CobN, partial [Pseudomonadota bacterium]
MPIPRRAAPTRDPSALPTGRNLYGFDPMRVPTPAAWEIGKGVLDQWWNSQIESGRSPKNLVFSLWAGETMRHQGVMEAQVFAAMGVQPIWDDRGRIEDLRLIPAEEMTRPRLNVTCTVTGSYRDQFPHAIAWINRAVDMVAQADSAETGGDGAENFVR